MELQRNKNLLYIKENIKAAEKTAHRMWENVLQLSILQRINIQKYLYNSKKPKDLRKQAEPGTAVIT